MYLLLLSTFSNIIFLIRASYICIFFYLNTSSLYQTKVNDHAPSSYFSLIFLLSVIILYIKHHRNIRATSQRVSLYLTLDPHIRRRLTIMRFHYTFCYYFSFTLSSFPSNTIVRLEPLHNPHLSMSSVTPTPDQS